MANEDILPRAFPDACDPEEPRSTFAVYSDIYSALAWRFLYWPDCFVVHDAVFLALNGNDEEFVRTRLDTVLESPVTPERWACVVDSFNFYELPHMLSGSRPLDDDAEDRAFVDVAHALRDAWSARLAQAYPERTFTVTVDEPSDGLAYRVSVVQTAVPPMSTP